MLQPQTHRIRTEDHSSHNTPLFPQFVLARFLQQSTKLCGAYRSVDIYMYECIHSVSFGFGWLWSYLPVCFVYFGRTRLLGFENTSCQICSPLTGTLKRHPSSDKFYFFFFLLLRLHLPLTRPIHHNLYNPIWLDSFLSTRLSTRYSEHIKFTVSSSFPETVELAIPATRLGASTRSFDLLSPGKVVYTSQSLLAPC